MLDKLRLLNPFTPIVTPDDASAAARAGTVGALLTIVSSLVGAVRVYLQRDQLLALARESANVASQDPETARRTAAMMEGLVTWMPLVTTGVVVVLYLVFGIVQWRRRTMMIPLIMLLFAAYGLVMGLFGAVMRGAQAQAQYQAFGMSIWEQGLYWIMALLTVALFWAGVRGGNRLKKIGTALDVSTF